MARPFASAAKTGRAASQPSGSSRRCMRSMLVGKVGILASVGFEQRAPIFVEASAAPAHAVLEMLAHAVRHQEFGVLGPAIAALGETDFLLAERLAVGGAGVVLVRGAIADVTFDDDQGRHIVGSLEDLDRLRQPLSIVGVADALHVPAIGKEPRRDIVAESEIRMPFDGDPVAVVDPAKVAQHLVTGERGRFARYALHHVAVAAYGINVVVEHREVRPIEMLRQPAPGERHADAVAAALAQRAGRRLDAGGQVIFGMAGAFAADLPKPLDIVERDRGLIETLVFGIDGFHAAEMQQRVEQHRGMAIGKDEAIAVGPDRVIRIEAQKILPERVGHRRQRHRRAGMAGIGLLYGVHRQSANCVNALLVDRACRCRTLPAFAGARGIRRASGAEIAKM